MSELSAGAAVGVVSDRTADSPAIRITLESPRTPDVVALIEELDGYLKALYPAESNHLLDLDALERPNVAFCVARDAGRAVGCGAAVLMPEGYAELKRMFVLPDQRGCRLGSRLLAFLEDEIAARGVAVARLETGVRQPEALALYERHGYRRIPPFGAYWDDPLCLFYEKTLTITSGEAV
jgi:putative acetyltransferase